MTYCPCTGQVVVKTDGIVSSVKFVSLKHSLPCKRFVVFETYTENPPNLPLNPLEGPENKTHHLSTLRYVAVVWNIQFLNDVWKQTWGTGNIYSLAYECIVYFVELYVLKTISLQYVEKYFACIYSWLSYSWLNVARKHYTLFIRI